METRSSRRKPMLTVLVTLALLLAGCYGDMALTKKVYGWNGTVPNSFARSVVFDAFWIVPVYEISMFIDVVILNPIEFWTGSNPVSGAASHP